VSRISIKLGLVSFEHHPGARDDLHLIGHFLRTFQAGANIYSGSLNHIGPRTHCGSNRISRFSVARALNRAVKESLVRRRLSQGVVPLQVRQLPSTEPLGIEYHAMVRIVVVHPGQRLNEPLLQ
jgi:hypothetical protein